MKKLILLIFLSYSLLANSVKIVKAEDIVSMYTNYRNFQERLIERKIIEPRLKEFSKKLFIELLSSKEKNREMAISYSAVLRLFLHKGENFSLPAQYQSLSTGIIQEINLIVNAKRRATSPILGVLIDYTLFKIPTQYSKSPDYFRAMKFAQTMPFVVNPSPITKITQKKSNSLLKTALNLKRVIVSSGELTRLYQEINRNLNDFIGIEDDFSLNDIDATKEVQELKAILNRNKKCPISSDMPVLLDLLDKKKQCSVSLSVRLFPSRYTIDNYILANVPKSNRNILSKQSLNDIIKAISPNKKIKSSFNNHPKILKKVHNHIKRALIVQNSSYDYDLKIMQKLINGNHIEAFKKYYTLVEKRAYLYKKKNRITTKEVYLMADIEPNLSQTLNVMIEGILIFSSSNRKQENKLLLTFKRLREIALKKEQEIRLSKKDIAFLRSI